ncbi:MAG: glutamate synthase large subunit, partial [Alphaproteobacteria bacterium]
MNDFVESWQRNAALLQSAHAYDPAQEHDACGVGMIVAIDGQPRRDVVLKGIEALKSLWHRGAVDADGKTGDGAGIHVQIPQNVYRAHIRRSGHEPGGGLLAVGMIFLPRTDLGAQERCRQIVETEILRYGHRIYGWRQVPVNVDVIGAKANATRPEIEQVMVENALGVGDSQFQVDLYVIRRRIE